MKKRVHGHFKFKVTASYYVGSEWYDSTYESTYRRVYDCHCRCFCHKYTLKYARLQLFTAAMS